MGKYVKGRRGTAAHRRHHQEKRAERTFASTSRGWRQPRERERKKKSKQIALSHLCVYPYAHRVYHVFSVVAVAAADVCGVWVDFVLGSG